MTPSIRLLAAGGLAFCALTSPASAQISNQDPGRFVQGLATTGFGALKGEKSAARGKFRSLLSQHFAVDAIGDRLIRRWKGKITPQQYAAYQAAFPSFIVGTYADRLYDYADAGIKIVRVQNQGANAAVLTQVIRPGLRPASAIWSLAKVGDGYKVTNLTVSGINIAVAQEADFNAYIQRNGFDALVAFMKKRG